MDTKKLLDYYDELDDRGHFEELGEEHGKGYHNPQSLKPKKVPLAVQRFVQKQDDSRRAFSFTYKAARFEESWLLDTLGWFFEQKWISDVVGKVRVGKEASVYLCRSGEQVSTPLLAAKIYRPRMLRNLKNDHVYRLGRTVLDENGYRVIDPGELRALQNRTSYGERLRNYSWITYEFNTLRNLYEAGADVPQPYEMENDAILMEYIGDESSPSSPLNGVTLEKSRVKPIFDSVMKNIHLMLDNDIIHADLSPYNILYWQGGISLIDFPQVISPQNHPSAWQIFHRDVTRVCEYFIHQGMALNTDRLAADIWKSHGYRIRPRVHPVHLDAEDPADRKAWQDNRGDD